MTNPDSPDSPRGTVDTRFDPIHSAARMRDLQAVQTELNAGVDVDVLNGRARNGDGGNTPLWFAAQGARSGLDVVRLLINAGADINLRCEHGRTALHMAAAWGHLAEVQLLLDHGADPDLRDDGGLTPAIMAAKSQRVAEANLKPVVDYLNALDRRSTR